MLATAPKVITLEEFLQLPETKPASEYNDGEITQKHLPKGRHSCLQYELCHAVNQLTKSKKIAYAFPELRCTMNKRSLVPDIAVFQWQNIPFLADGEVPDSFNVAPDWAIEILSPDQNSSKVIGNLIYYLENGSKLGWFLDPSAQTILVLLGDRPPKLIEGNNIPPTLEGINLELSVEQIFGWLKMGTLYSGTSS
jgi:Uma2 family endonuclease